MNLFNVIRPESKKRFDSEHTLVGQYLENNCVDDPVKLCDFQLLENRIMKTVDSVYQVTSAGLDFHQGKQKLPCHHL